MRTFAARELYAKTTTQISATAAAVIDLRKTPRAITAALPVIAVMRACEGRHPLLSRAPEMASPQKLPAAEAANGIHATPPICRSENDWTLER